MMIKSGFGYLIRGESRPWTSERWHWSSLNMLNKMFNLTPVMIKLSSCTLKSLQPHLEVWKKNIINQQLLFFGDAHNLTYCQRARQPHSTKWLPVRWSSITASVSANTIGHILLPGIEKPWPPPSIYPGNPQGTLHWSLLNSYLSDLYLEPFYTGRLHGG